MASKSIQKVGVDPKKTNIGHGRNRKWGSKGGGTGGSTTSKTYKKRYRGQG